MSRKHPDAKKPFRSPPTPGTNGRGRCRWCWGDVQPPRRTFCSQICVDEFRMETDWKFVRHVVQKRDAGVCVFCGIDTAWLVNVLLHLRGIEWWNGTVQGDGDGSHSSKRWVVLHRRLLDCATYRDPWEADHIHARADGGRDHPDNLRTLCIRCHKARTAEQSRLRAIARRDAKSTLFVDTKAVPA